MYPPGFDIVQAAFQRGFQRTVIRFSVRSKQLGSEKGLIMRAQIFDSRFDFLKCAHFFLNVAAATRALNVSCSRRNRAGG